MFPKVCDDEGMTTHRTQKVEAGWYQYRDFNIVKHTKGFDEKTGRSIFRDRYPTGWYVSGPRYVHFSVAPLSSLAEAKRSIDTTLGREIQV